MPFKDNKISSSSENIIKTDPNPCRSYLHPIYKASRVSVSTGHLVLGTNSEMEGLTMSKSGTIFWQSVGLTRKSLKVQRKGTGTGADTIIL